MSVDNVEVDGNVGGIPAPAIMIKMNYAMTTDMAKHQYKTVTQRCL